MKLVVPYHGAVRPADARLIRVAEFLGIAYQQSALTRSAGSAVGSDDSASDGGSCLLINPEVIREWTEGVVPSPEFASSLISPFRNVLIHAVRPDPFHSALIKSLTAGRFQAVKEVLDSECAFNVASDSKDVCGPFAGLSFGKANSGNDRTFTGGIGNRNLITLGSEAHFVVIRLDKTSVFLLGSEDVADLDAETGEDWLLESFSKFVPHAMALRYIFGEQCWRPIRTHACVIVDDPLLRANYGFLNFNQLVRLMEEHNFRTTVAFIPYNFRRSSPRVVRIFRKSEDRLSLCFHGNDHTGAEFAASDPVRLNTMIQTAEDRIGEHSRITGLHCDRLMIFPQGKFSVEAMAALRSRNFEAAINTVPHPYHQPIKLTLRELAQPAVMRYSEFPLFLRRNSQRMQHADIAFRLFFGIPLLIGEHHDVFEDPKSLINAVIRINKVAPDICWSSAGVAVRGSVLHRRDANGNLCVKAYSGTVHVECSSPSRERILIHWIDRGRDTAIKGVQRNGVGYVPFDSNDPETRVSAVLEPGITEEFSIRYHEGEKVHVPVRFRYNMHAFVRRRLSEIRDNYISKSPLLLETAKALQRRVQH